MRSVQSFAILASIFAASVAQADPLFSENFENGAGNWSASDGNPVGSVSDEATPCSTTFQHEVAQSPTRYMTANTQTAIATSGSYCLSAWVRASSQSNPFLGFAEYAADGSLIGYRYGIGDATYVDAFGDQIVGVSGDETWHWYAATMAIDATAVVSIDMFDQITGDSGYADFDDITLAAGPCPEAYAGVDQHQVCAGDTPVCTIDGSCQPVAVPPADMGGPSSTPDMSGGPSSTPDMGAAPSPTAPGGNVALNPPPSTPVAAEGSPAGGGSVTAPSATNGGCGVAGNESDRSFAVLLIAFVGVMLASIRRRRRA